MIRRLNHAVLYVRDTDESVAFYRDVLGFEEVNRLGDRAAFLQVPGSDNDHDLALFGIGQGAGAPTAGRQTVGLYHLAWEVDTLAQLAELRDRLAAAGALVGASNHGGTKSLYAEDPNGLEFEVMWEIPEHLKEDRDREMGVWALDLDAELERFGAASRNG
jgi:catechol 2,3-dioxygenase-like lactoylglutathione lyase family enzyme